MIGLLSAMDPTTGLADGYEASLTVVARIPGTTVSDPALLFACALAVGIDVPALTGGRVSGLALAGTPWEGSGNRAEDDCDCGKTSEALFEGFAGAPGGLDTIEAG